MDNEVVIHVRADDNTDAGFASAKRKAGKFGKDIEDEVRKSGPSIGKWLSGGLVGGVSDALPSISPLLVSGMAAAAPLIGGVMAGAVIGGAGIGGVLGGILLVKDDPRVASAGKALGERLLGDLKKDATPFIAPVLKAIDQVGVAWKGLRPVIAGVFQDSSRFVQPLVSGVLSAVSKITHGFGDMVSNAGPVINQLSQSFSQIGGAVGDVFSDLSKHSAEGATSIRDLTDAITFLIEASGKTVGALATTKGWIDQSYEATQRWLHALENKTGWDLQADGMSVSERAAKELADKQGVLAGATDDAAAAAQRQTDATKAQQSALQSLADEMKAQTDPLFALIKGQRDVSAAQKDYNKALRDHGPRSAQAREALEKLGQAAFDLNGKAITAAGGFNGKLTPAMRTALHNAGLTSGQMNRLERALEDSAGAAHAWEGTYRQTYVTSFKQFGKPYSQAAIDSGNIGGLASGGIKGAASGMIGGGFTWTGEHGPELLQLPPGTRVHSNPDSMRMAGGGRGQGGQLEVVLTAAETGGSGLMSAILKALRYEVRSQGGNVQQVLGVQGR